MITKDDYQLLRLHPAFSAIPVELFDKLAVEIHARDIPKGQILFFAGDKRDRIFLLEKGFARIEQFDSADQFSYMEQLLFITRKLSSILKFQELRLRNVVTASASERVIQSLAILCKDYEALGNQLPFPISMKEMAKLAATTRETVNQVLKKLMDSQKIQYERKQLRFIDSSYFLKSFEEID